MKSMDDLPDIVRTIEFQIELGRLIGIWAAWWHNATACHLCRQVS
jgi:hypothetical protein